MKKTDFAGLVLLITMFACETVEPIAQEPVRSDKKIIFELLGPDYSEPRYDSLKISIYMAAGHRHQDSINNVPKWDTLFESITAKEFIHIQDRFEITFKDVSEKDVVFFGANVQYKMLGIIETTSSFEQKSAGSTYQEFFRDVAY